MIKVSLIVDFETHYFKRCDVEEMYKKYRQDAMHRRLWALEDKRLYQTKAGVIAREKATSPSRWIESMDEFGVDKIIIHASPFIKSDTCEAFVKQRPDRFLGLAHIDFWDQNAPQELRRCIEKLGLRGVGEINVSLQKIDMGDERFFPIYKEAQELDVAITVHFSGPSRYGNPFLLYDACKEFPSLRFVVHHLGQDYVKELYVLMRSCPNVYSVLSGLSGIPGTLMSNIELKDILAKFLALGVERFFWGSDLPVPYLYVTELGRPPYHGLQDDQVIKALNELKLPERDKARIIGGNAVSCLGEV